MCMLIVECLVIVLFLSGVGDSGLILDVMAIGNADLKSLFLAFSIFIVPFSAIMWIDFKYAEKLILLFLGFLAHHDEFSIRRKMAFYVNVWNYRCQLF